MPPPQDNILGAGASAEEFGRSDKDLEKIRMKFYALSADIKVANNNILALMQTERTIANWTFSSLTKEQNADFNKEMAQVNEYLGAADTMLDSYVILTNSKTDVKKLFNIIYDLITLIKNHKKSIGFQFYVREEKKYLYPKPELEDMLAELTMLFGRLCGNLKAGGEYITDFTTLEGAGQRGNENRGYGNGYDSRYRSPSAVPENEPREERDLGM